jgi:hypothetical protein
VELVPSTSLIVNAYSVTSGLILIFKMYDLVILFIIFPYVASFSGLSFFSLPLRYSLTFICPVSCVHYVASFSGLSFFITPSVLSNIYLSCVLCTLCCQFLWIVLFLLPLPYSLTCICPVSCEPYVARFSGLSFFITPWVFSNIYFSCVLCTQCNQFLLTQDTGQIHVREYRRDNKKRTIQRNWQHWVHKKQDK